MADKAAPKAKAEPRDPRDVDREAELDRQAAVAQAVHDATHDKAGDPLPLGGAPAGITLIEGKP